jgi:hypothetical protein
LHRLPPGIFWRRSASAIRRRYGDAIRLCGIELIFNKLNDYPGRRFSQVALHRSDMRRGASGRGWAQSCKSISGTGATPARSLVMQCKSGL